MADGDDFGQAVAGPLSWRDVYRAVEESEKRILKAVGDLAVELRGQADDHERRIRYVEDAPKRVSTLEGGVAQYHLTTDARLTQLERAAAIAEAKALERGSIILSTRTLVVSLVSIITSIIVASAGAIAMLDRLVK